MKIRFFFSLLFFSLFICIASFAMTDAITEELFIVTDGPIAINGGLLRYYTDCPEENTSIRYSYKGLDSGNILIQKTTCSQKNTSQEKELIKLPLRSKKATLIVGSRKVYLKLNEHDRVIVRETK